MRVAAAQLPEIEDSDDKVFTNSNTVVMLDGASAFVPVPIAPSVYADQLGRRVRAKLVHEPTADLARTLATAIAATADRLKLKPGHAPSSTVTILREHDGWLDLLVLGNNLVVIPGAVMLDDRIDRLDLPARRAYQERLANATGFDDEHQEILRELQTQQARWRNRDDGYWIAEASGEAARHAIIKRVRVEDVPWVVLTTDGAYNTMQHLGIDDWGSLINLRPEELSAIVQRCQTWEAEVDPSAQQLPRAKRHDDKSLAVVRLHS